MNYHSLNTELPSKSTDNLSNQCYIMKVMHDPESLLTVKYNNPENMNQDLPDSNCTIFIRSYKTLFYTIPDFKTLDLIKPVFILLFNLQNNFMVVNATLLSFCRRESPIVGNIQNDSEPDVSITAIYYTGTLRIQRKKRSILVVDLYKSS